MLRTVFIFGFIITLLMLRGAAHAENRVALVIGNGAYNYASKLKNPRNDAEDMAVKLQSLGFDVFEGTDLTVQGTRTILEQFAVALRRADVALVFYAGHGVQIDGVNYIVPVDAQWETADDLAANAVSLEAIQTILRARPRLNLILFDACRDNPFLKTRSLSRSGRQVQQGWAAIGQPSVDTYISFASEPGSVAADGTGRNSPFTEALLKEIGRQDEDIQTMMRRVRQAVIEATGGQQTPWERSSMISSFAFGQSNQSTFTGKPWLTAARTSYTQGEKIKLTITPPEDCRLTLINVDSAGKSCLLFPHPKLPDDVLKAGVAVTFPPRGSMRLHEAGEETFIAMCNASEAAKQAAKRDTTLINCSRGGGGSSGGGNQAYTDKILETVLFDLDDDDTQGGARTNDITPAQAGQQVLRETLTVRVTAP
ncbi:MAG: caspase family protein [Pseudomonadota bacterium]